MCVVGGGGSKPHKSQCCLILSPVGEGVPLPLGAYAQTVYGVVGALHSVCAALVTSVDDVTNAAAERPAAVPAGIGKQRRRAEGSSTSFLLLLSLMQHQFVATTTIQQMPVRADQRLQLESGCCCTGHLQHTHTPVHRCAGLTCALPDGGALVCLKPAAGKFTRAESNQRCQASN